MASSAPGQLIDQLRGLPGPTGTWGDCVSQRWREDSYDAVYGPKLRHDHSVSPGLLQHSLFFYSQSSFTILNISLHIGRIQKKILLSEF